MSDKINITFECPECGGTVLELPDDYTDDSDTICKQCRVNFGRWGDIKAKATSKASDELQSLVRSAFKGVKGFKIKN